MTLHRTVLWSCLLCFVAVAGMAQEKPKWTKQEQPLVDKIRTLRKLPDDVRWRTTSELALSIRQLSPVPNKLRLATALANLSTEGDPGSEVLQEVATTLAEALREQPVQGQNGRPDDRYIELAELVRYEHVRLTMTDPQFDTAMKLLEEMDARRQSADFTLLDLSGKPWTLKALKGKVVMVNFWATWCPPCQKEMPDLQTLYDRFRDQGLVILALDDEDAAKIAPFIAQRHYSYPILLDDGHKIAEVFGVDGIPKTFVFDREGRLVAQSIDMRTQKQFLAMLAQAGLQ